MLVPCLSTSVQQEGILVLKRNEVSVPLPASAAIEKLSQQARSLEGTQCFAGGLPASLSARWRRLKRPCRRWASRDVIAVLASAVSAASCLSWFAECSSRRPPTFCGAWRAAAKSARRSGHTKYMCQSCRRGHRQLISRQATAGIGYLLLTYEGHAWDDCYAWWRPRAG